MLISNPVRVLRSEESGIVVVWAGEVEGSKWAVRARSPTPDHQVGSRSAGSAVSGDIWATCEERRVCGCISPASGRGEGKAVPAMACAELFCAQGQPARRNWGRYDLLVVVPHPSLLVTFVRAAASWCVYLVRVRGCGAFVVYPCVACGAFALWSSRLLLACLLCFSIAS
jgi:hypothetical protein